jgi:hypothetical protein
LQNLLIRLIKKLAQGRCEVDSNVFVASSHSKQGFLEKRFVVEDGQKKKGCTLFWAVLLLF